MNDEQIDIINNELGEVEYKLNNLLDIKNNISYIRNSINNINKEICNLKKEKALIAYEANNSKPNIKHFIVDIIIIVVVLSLMLYNLSINTSELLDIYKILNNLISIVLGCGVVLFVSNLKDNVENEKDKYQKLLDIVKDYDIEINSKKKDLSELNNDLNHYMNTYPCLDKNISNLYNCLDKLNIILNSICIENKEIEKYEQRRRTNSNYRNKDN